MKMAGVPFERFRFEVDTPVVAEARVACAGRSSRSADKKPEGITVGDSLEESMEGD